MFHTTESFSIRSVTIIDRRSSQTEKGAADVISTVAVQGGGGSAGVSPDACSHRDIPLSVV